MIIEKAYAKLNLTLNVLGKREDGFHELESIMVPISDLYDELIFEENDSDEIVLVDNLIEDNSILKAAKAFQQKYNTKGCKIRLIKRIPLAAGLAGGSADSSATLRGMNKLFGLNIPLEELEDIAITLGSDNVFCLYNKAAVCRGKGEKLEFIDSKFNLQITIIKPPFGILTKDVFAALDLGEINKNSKELVLKALKENDIKLLEENIYNDLLKPALMVENRLSDLINLIKNSGYKCFMSGSGSALYVLGKIDIVLEKDIYFETHFIKNSIFDC